MAEPLVLAAQAMGTRFELVLSDPERRLGRRRLGAAGEAALAVIHETEARWSLFKKTSALAELNRSGHQRPLALDGDDLALFAVIAHVHSASGGAFDPDVARAMRELGHHPGAQHAEQSEPGRGRWLFDPDARQLRFSAPGPALDLGGVAKGHALDLAAAELRGLGVRCALLHGGTSSAIALGAPPGRAAWSVEVAGVQLALRGRALGASRAGSQLAGDRGHVLSPPASGGRPSRAAPRERAACVLAPTAALADAWSTALVARPELATEARQALDADGLELLQPLAVQPL